MKKLLLIVITCPLFLTSVYAQNDTSSIVFNQGLEVSSSYCISSNPIFQNAYGFGLSYSKQLGKLIQLDAELNHYFNTRQIIGQGEEYPGGTINYFYYNYTYTINQTAVRLNFLLTLRNNQQLFVGIGPNISYNVMSSPEISTCNLWGMGLLAKIEIRDVFTPKLSVCVNFRPEFIFGGPVTVFSDGTLPPSYKGMGTYFIGEFQAGLKYSFLK